MDTKHGNSSASNALDPTGEQEQADVLLPYVPPTMVFVGRVHDLVAGGGGTTDEMSDPFLQKQAGQPG